jgi:hypothetical protein
MMANVIHLHDSYQTSHAAFFKPSELKDGRGARKRWRKTCSYLLVASNGSSMSRRYHHSLGRKEMKVK